MLHVDTPVAPTTRSACSRRLFVVALTRACWGLSLGRCICACARACVGTRRTSRINPHTGRQLNFWHLSVYPGIHLLHQILGYHVGAAISANCTSNGDFCGLLHQRTIRRNSIAYQTILVLL